ncbi:MAG: Uma2 family endonuclease [Verrucomicrobia bacterium]|nr:Uma2 family endonuclease [Verrucomicrobiota bacterium]
MKTIPVLSTDEIQEDRPGSSRNHSRVAHNLSGLLYGYRDRFSVHQQLALNLDGWQTVPDLCAYLKGAIPLDWETDDDECTVPPDLVIEILSPKQNLQPLVDKVREYLRHGVKSCWVIVPAARVISVFPAQGGSRSCTEGLLKDEVTGLEVPVAEVFS